MDTALCRKSSVPRLAVGPGVENCPRSPDFASGEVTLRTETCGFPRDASWLEPGLDVAQPITAAADVEYVAAVKQPVEQRGGHHLVALNGLSRRPSTAPTARRRRWYRTAPYVTSSARAIARFATPFS